MTKDEYIILRMKVWRNAIKANMRAGYTSVQAVNNANYIAQEFDKTFLPQCLPQSEKQPNDTNQ